MEGKGYTLTRRERSLIYCQERCYFAYKSTRVGSSQQEGSEGQADNFGCHKGSSDPSCIQEEDIKGDVRCPG
jgi:hypothetical protein